MKKKYLIHTVWIIIVAVALAGGFFWGKSTASARGGAGNFSGAAAGARGFGGARGGGGGGLVSGQITSNDGQSLTVQLQNGNSENVFYSSSTQVIKPAPAPVTALMPGAMVLIGGTTNSDGSITAQSIQIRQGNANSGTAGSTGR